MLNCKDASQLISEGLDRPLQLRERWGLRLHLWICVNCRRFSEQLHYMRWMFRAVARFPEVDKPAVAGLSPAANARIRQRIAERREQPR